MNYDWYYNLSDSSGEQSYVIISKIIIMVIYLLYLLLVCVTLYIHTIQ